MKIAVVGAGKVGSALGGRWSELGHEVTYGVRDPSDPKYQRLARRLLVKEAVAAADVVVIAIPWREVEGLAGELDDLGDRVVLDASNPLAGGPQSAGFTSGAENIAVWTGSKRVVKAFNTTGAANVRNPVYPDGRPVMFVAADDPEAKQTAMELANQIGFDAQDAGPLMAARDLEHLAALWIRMAYGLGQGPDIAYTLLRR